MAGLVQGLRAADHTIEQLDLGGGFGIPYQNELAPTPSEIARRSAETIGDLGCARGQAGRSIIGGCGRAGRGSNSSRKAARSASRWSMPAWC